MIQLIPVMEVKTYPDAAALMDAAAEDFLAIARGAIGARGRCLVALSGGSTPRGMYERLAARGPTALDWSRIVFLWSDERNVPPDHPASNYRMAREALLGPLAIPETQVYRMRGEAEDIEAAAREYEHTLAALTGVQPGHGVPQLDLVLLGLGSDAHVASLFPGHASLRERDRLVVGEPEAGLEPFVPRVTLTLPTLCDGRHIVFLVTGEGKAEAAERAFGGDSSEDAPASLVRPREGEMTVLLDPAAAGRLRP